MLRRDLMNVRRAFSSALAAAALLPIPSVHAFDMNGFRGGMSIDAFVAHARAQGYKVTLSGMSGDDLPQSTWVGERLLGATMEREAAPKRLAAFLCGGKLKSLSEVADGGLDEFVRDVADAQKRFSAPGTAEDAVSRRVTPKHFVSSLAVGWTDAAGENTYKVEIVSASGSTAIHRGWSIRLNGCDEG
jgi:hypothetical protein